MKDADGQLGVSDYRTVEKSDKIDYLALGFGANANNPSALFLKTPFQLGSFKSGLISGEMGFNFNIRRKPDWVEDDYSSDQTIPNIFGKSTFTYPIAAKKKTGVAKIILSNDSPEQLGAYTIDKNSSFYRIVSLEGGFGFDVTEFESTKWALDKISNSPTPISFSGQPEGNTVINQGTVSGYFGLRLSQFINTYISGSSEGVTYTGQKKEVLDVRIGLVPLIHSTAHSINYTYNTYENSTWTTQQEFVPVQDFLKKSWLGHSIGVSWTSFSDALNVSTTCFIDWYVIPGYKENYFDTQYIRVGYNFGISPKRFQK